MHRAYVDRMLDNNSHNEFSNLYMSVVTIKALDNHQFCLDLEVLLLDIAFPRRKDVEFWKARTPHFWQIESENRKQVEN